jgi:uncharacterized protein (TIGR03663 family)
VDESGYSKTPERPVDLVTLLFWATVIIGVLLRFYDLGSKPLHHDESLYGVYCWRFFKGEGYTYDPMMHGPFMFHFQLLIFFLGGIGDAAVRLAPALFGSLMLAGTYYLKDWLGKVGMLCVAVLLAFSPTHLYFSRFMRHDIYIAFFTYAAVIAGLWLLRIRRPALMYLCAAALSLMFCVKENAYIHLFIFVTFWLIKELCQAHLFRFPDTAAPVGRLRTFLRAWKYPLLFAALIFIWIYLLLYSTFFTNPGGFLDGLYRKSLTYWWNQHSIQRIKGPFHYYVSFIVLYELPAFLIAVGGVLIAVSRTLNRAIIAVWATLFSAALILFFGDTALPQAYFGIAHMEIAADLILTLYVVGIGLWAMLHFLRQRQTLTAFWVYWAGMSFLIYSYAGEKVPWLFLHILTPVVLLAGALIQQAVEANWRPAQPLLRPTRRTAAVLGSVLAGAYLLHTTILLNYYYPANPVERMVYTQTSTDMTKLMELIEDVEFSLGVEEAKEPLIAVQGSAVWPLAWYLRDYDSWYHPGDLADALRPLIVVDWDDRQKYRELLQDDYQELRLKLREWWIPASTGTLKDWWQYFLYRRVFNPTGSLDVAVYLRR